MVLKVLFLLVVSTFETVLMAKVWDAMGILAMAALGGCERLYMLGGHLSTGVSSIMHALFSEMYSIVACMATTVHHSLLMGHVRRQRRRRIIMESSRRTKRVLDILDTDEIGDDELELVERKEYVRCSVLISRRARMGLKYPSYSQANERIAADWILKHLPDDMTIGVKHKVLPLAVKLTFVRSRHEDYAAWDFNALRDLVDFSQN